MSTIDSFVRIEGRFSQQCSRAAGFLPPPFGEKWALRSSEGGLRAELCAFLRTFCLRDEAIWSMCHWASVWPEQAPVEVVKASAPPLATPGGSDRAPGSVMNTPLYAPAPHGHLATRPASRAAAACAICGAAVLAWLGIGLLSQHHPDTDPAAIPQPDVAQDAGLAAPPRDGGGQAAEAKLATAATRFPLESANHEPFPLKGADHAQPRRKAANHAQPRLEGAHHAHHGRREIHRAARHKAHDSTTPTANVTNLINVTRHAGPAVLSAASPRLALAEHARRSMARTSAAGRYSPSVPPALGSSDYAAITMPSDARLDATLATPRGNANDIEWISHISQRRITEVPDAFSR